MSEPVGLAEKVRQAQLKLRQPKKDAKGERSVYLDLPDAIAYAYSVFCAEGVTIGWCSELIGGRLYVGARFEAGNEASPWFWAPVVAKVILPKGTNWSALSPEAIEAMTTPGPQEYGSAMTYARRYAICGLTGIVGDKDDDAQSVQDLIRKSAEPDMDEPEIEPPKWVIADAKLAATLSNRPLEPMVLKSIAATFKRSVIVASSDGDGEHEVRRDADGGWRCGCKGFAVYKACRHAAIAELHHRLVVLGHKWMMAPETIDEMDRKAARAAIEETADIRAKLSSGAGPWVWAPPANGGAK